jgi:hypothetical protein
LQVKDKMDVKEVETNPAQDWQASLNSTCNKFTTQYLTLVKAAAGVSTVTTNTSFDGRSATSASMEGANSSVTEGHRGTVMGIHGGEFSTFGEMAV